MVSNLGNLGFNFFDMEARNFRDSALKGPQIIFTARFYLFSQYCADLPLFLGKMIEEVDVEEAVFFFRSY